MRVLRTRLRTGLGRWWFRMCPWCVSSFTTQKNAENHVMGALVWGRCHVDSSVYQNKLIEEVGLQCRWRLCGSEAGHFRELQCMRERANVQPHLRERAQS